MGKIDFFSIILYKPDKVYYSSESVVGNVSIRVLERLKCNSISMMLSGKARVHWLVLEDQIRFKVRFKNCVPFVYSVLCCA